MRTGPTLNRRSNADDRIGSASARFTDCAVEGGVARAIEDVAEFPDFAAREGFQRAEYAAAHTDGISNIAEHMLDRLIARVHVRKQFLCVASAGEQSLGLRLGVDARADEKNLRAAAEGPEFARHACNPEAPCRDASSVNRASAAARPSWIAWVTCGTSPPKTLVSPAPREPRKPMALTLLPTTSSPAEYCFRAK